MFIRWHGTRLFRLNGRLFCITRSASGCWIWCGHCLLCEYCGLRRLEKEWCKSEKSWLVVYGIYFLSRFFSLFWFFRCRLLLILLLDNVCSFEIEDVARKAREIIIHVYLVTLISILVIPGESLKGPSRILTRKICNIWFRLLLRLNSNHRIRILLVEIGVTNPSWPKNKKLFDYSFNSKCEKRKLFKLLLFRIFSSSKWYIKVEEIRWSMTEKILNNNS